MTMRYCSRCLLPETSESLTFDQEGVCSVCRQIEYKRSEIDWAARDRDLDKFLEDFRGKANYDCIVPFSGGKDSTYTLWYLMKVKKLKPLVVRFDHGFMRKQIDENNLRTFRTLGADVVTFTPNWQIVRKLMFESLRRRGDFCWHCHCGIFAYPMWVAIKEKVPLMFWGEKGEYTSFYSSYDEEWEHDERRFNLKVNLGINAEDMLGMLDGSISDYPVTARDLWPYTFPPRAELRKLGVRSMFLGNYIPWDVKKHVDVIKRELGWGGSEVEGVPPEYDYEKIECYMQGVRDYIRYLKRGFGRTTHLASIDIRNERMSREQGVNLVNEFDGKRPAALDFFLDILDIDEDSFYKLIEPHVVGPHTMPDCESCKANRVNRAPADFSSHPKIVGDLVKDRRVSGAVGDLDKK